MQHDRTITTVRDRVAEKIGHLLGKFANGNSAIAIQPPIPPDFGEGVHCILERHGERKGLSSVSEWQVAIVMVPSNDEAKDDQYNQNFDVCLYEMRYWFPRSRELHTKYLGFYPQTNFFLVFEKEEFHL